MYNTADTGGNTLRKGISSGICRRFELRALYGGDTTLSQTGAATTRASFMFINKLNQLYKPRRLLYYTETSQSDLEDFYKGKPRGPVAEYTDAFGTYDDPGIFFIEKLGRPVIGIEYRMDDSRVEYPADLESVVLEASFFYQIETANDADVSLDSIHEIFGRISRDEDVLIRNNSKLSIKEHANTICIFASGGDNRIRILYECEVVRDNAK
ncbi:MAG: hypothetical protein J6X60_02400 [Ruminiclostridium sp.]|nr:hypothetical protein [Ruminiclostridium sp.]